MVALRVPSWAKSSLDHTYELVNSGDASSKSFTIRQWRSSKAIIGLACAAFFFIVFAYLPTTVTDKGVAAIHGSPNTLVTYVFNEDELDISRANFEFFLQHGLHGKADFVFIFNGETSAWQLVPDLPNVKVVLRDNTCYDMGAHAEVLQKDGLYKRYKQFIMMNGSIRGPFLPAWAKACWTDRFLSMLTDETKLVGMTFNCWPTPHIASMLWGTDRIGLDLLLHPPANSPSHNEFLAKLNEHYPNLTQSHGPDYVDQGINKCAVDRTEAVEAEISGAGIIKAGGYKATSLLAKAQIDDNFLDNCWNHGGTIDPQGNGYYDGMNYHPFETLFIKTNRNIDPNMISKYTIWANEANYSSWDYC